MATRSTVKHMSREQFASAHETSIVTEPNTVYSFHDASHGAEIFHAIDHIFTDADGTVVSEGATTLDAHKADLVRKLHEQGIGTTIITGKPYPEVEKLHKSLPTDLPISFIYEKGAYELHFDPEGKPIQRYLLSSEALEQSVLSLKQEFADFRDILIQKYSIDKATPTLGFGWAGSGAHRSIVSIDIFSCTPPDGYLELIGSYREALKLTDNALLEAVVADITAFVRERQPTWSVIHLGNGNIDVTPDAIEKDTAIAANKPFQDARRVLVLGDTENDRAMFRLRNTYSDKVVAGLVYHRQQAVALLDDVDVASVGMANADPILAAVLAIRTDA